MAKLKSEEEVKELFADIKWGDKFCCARCGCSEYTKGDKFPDRRCSRCKKNESLYVNTALEGLRFGADKMYRILDILYESLEFTYERDVIYLDGFYTSIDSLNNEYAHYFSGENGEMWKLYLIHESYLRREKKLCDIAKKVCVEENTVSLRLKRIAQRISEWYQKDNYYDTIKWFIKEGEYHTRDDVYMLSFEDFLRIILFPAKGSWHKGLLSYNGNNYEFGDGPHFSFSMVRDRNDSVEAIDEFDETEDELEDITYASEIWRKLFVENFKAK